MSSSTVAGRTLFMSGGSRGIGLAIATRPAAECTGRSFMDDDVLAEEGVRDLSAYRYGDSDEDLQVDLFL
jgi:NAD(P)-dependent dehydrogenase (short-subunit alcohol dehydrogenase family)